MQVPVNARGRGPAPEGRLLLELARDGAESGAEVRPDEGKGGDRCNCDQRRDQRILDRRNTRPVVDEI